MRRVWHPAPCAGRRRPAHRDRVCAHPRPLGMDRDRQRLVPRIGPRRFSLHVFHLGTETDQETAFARSRAAHFVQNAQRASPMGGGDPRRSGSTSSSIRKSAWIRRPSSSPACGSRRFRSPTWGHPETTGLPTIDYYLSAEDLEPANAQETYTEELVELPHLGCCYQSLASRSRRARSRRAGPRFRSAAVCSVPDALQICASLRLRSSSQSRGSSDDCQFVFFSHDQDALTDQAAAAPRFGVRRCRTRVRRFRRVRSVAAAARVLWPAGALRRLSRHDRLFRVQHGDAGGRMRLPIVTREGSFLRGRLASGILKRMGLAELVAATEEEYVTLRSGSRGTSRIAKACVSASSPRVTSSTTMWLRCGRSRIFSRRRATDDAAELAALRRRSRRLRRGKRASPTAECSANRRANSRKSLSSEGPRLRQAGSGFRASKG